MAYLHNPYVLIIPLMNLIHLPKSNTNSHVKVIVYATNNDLLNTKRSLMCIWPQGHLVFLSCFPCSVIIRMTILSPELSSRLNATCHKEGDGLMLLHPLIKNGPKDEQCFCICYTLNKCVNLTLNGTVQSSC